AGTPPDNASPPAGVDMNRRAALFQSVEKEFTTGIPIDPKTKKPTVLDAAQAHKKVYEKALNLVVSSRKEVFNLPREVDRKPIDHKLKDEDGNAPFGRSALLARKLVEAGTAAVQITMGGWDLHANTHTQLATRMLPTLDKAMGTLVKDLDQRGKLKDTVIVW